MNSLSFNVLVRNSRLAVVTSLRHLREDPATFALLLSRRLPSAVTGPVARAILRSASAISTSPVVLTAALVTGRTEDLARRLDLAVADAHAGRPVGRPRAGTRWAAEVALAAGRIEAADALIASTSTAPNPAMVRTVARRQSYLGNLSEAVAAADEAGPRTQPFAERLRSELRVFSGWTPSLPTAASSPTEPVPGRVLHLLTNSLPHTGSGYAQRSHSILLAQRDAGLDPLAVTRLGYPVQVGRVLAKDTDDVDGVTYRRLLTATPAQTMTGRLQQQADLLLDIGRGFRPAVVHTTTDFTNGLVAGAVARALRVPLVYEVRGRLADTWASTRPQSARSSERYRLFSEREADVMRSADVVLTLGETMRKFVLEAGVPADRVLLTPNAVGGAYLAEPGTSAAARRRLGLPADGLLIGTVSSLVDYEGLDDLIAAVSRLAPRYPSVGLMFVGSGAAEPALRRAVAAAGLDQRTIFAGRVPREAAVLYHQALDVFVVPRKDLAVTRAVTPLKPVEAQASARAVVASDLPALREIVNDGVTGLLAPPDDPAGLTLVLERLVQDAGLRDRLGRAARDHVLAHRTWAANARVIAAAYDRAWTTSRPDGTNTDETNAGRTSAGRRTRT